MQRSDAPSHGVAQGRLIVPFDESPPRYRRPVSAWELRGQPPFVREAMSPTFGAIFCARRPGETPAVLYARAGALREVMHARGAVLDTSRRILARVSDASF